MGMRTSAKTEEVFEGTFECRSCAFQAEATVHAIGWGGAGGVGSNARELAVQDAVEDAGAVASRSLTFVPCPQCGKLDPSARSYRLQVIVGSVLLGVFAAAGLYAYADARYGAGHGMTWLFSVFGLLMASLAFWKWSRPWAVDRCPRARHHSSCGSRDRDGRDARQASRRLSGSRHRRPADYQATLTLAADASLL